MKPVIKRMIKLVLIATGTAFTLNAFFVAKILSFNAGVLLGIVISLAVLFFGLFYFSILKIKWLFVSIAAGLFLFAVCSMLLLGYGKNDNVTFQEDAVIVFGAGLRGEQVSIILSRRLEAAIQYYNSNPKAVIVVSGGQGAYETISEALAMERYLIQKGIPQEKIIKEDRSTSSYENLLFSKKLLDEHFGRDYRVVIATNDFHVYRSTFLAKTLGMEATHIHGNTDWYLLISNCAREILAVVKSWAVKQ